MESFDHFSPESLAEALEMLAEKNGAAVIAGGTDLLLQMKAGRRKPGAVINIKRLPELKGLTFDEETGLRLGALVTLRDLTRAPRVRERYPVLAQTAHRMASEQVRSFATLGGNLCNASPSADLAPPLIALDAFARLVGPEGERTLPLEAFFTGPGKSALAPGELLKEIRVPPPTGESLYLKHAPRAYMDIAVVGAALRLRMDGASCRECRIVLGAVAPVPLRARRAEEELTGRPITAEGIERAAEAAAAGCRPIDDVRASAWYRTRMAAVLVRRGLSRLARTGPL